MACSAAFLSGPFLFLRLPPFSSAPRHATWGVPSPACSLSARPCDGRLLAAPHGARLAPPKADGSDRHQAQSRRTHPWRGGLSTVQKPGRNKEAVRTFRLSPNGGAEGISALRKAPLHRSSIFPAYEMMSRCPKRTVRGRWGNCPSADISRRD